MDSFSSYHPAINFLYFTVVLLVTMFMMQPVFLAISCVCAYAYSIYLKGKKALKFNFLYMLPVLLIAALMNPAFNHEGVTILVYINGNPITLESIYYGFAAGCMLVCVIVWFSCYNVVMTSDKFIYLFGRVIPALSLILSMVLRFVPKFKAQIKEVSRAQKCIGRDVSNGNVLMRARFGLRILSIMMTWAFENSIDTADSMKARGYGLKGRTSFSIFRFDARDRVLLCCLAGLMAVVLCALFSGQIFVKYFPSFHINEPTPFAVLIYVCYAALCAAPLILDLLEDAKWHYLQSRI